MNMTRSSTASCWRQQRDHRLKRAVGNGLLYTTSYRPSSFHGKAHMHALSTTNSLSEDPINEIPVPVPLVPLRAGSREMVSVKQYLYTNRMIFLDKTITEEVASRVCADMLYMEHLDEKEDNTIYMHTKAISTYALNSLVDVMAYVKPEVATVCVGTVAGVASTVLAAGERGKRSAMPNSRIMLCQPKSGVEGDLFEVGLTVSESNRQFQFQTNLLQKYTGLDLEQCEELVDRETYLSAEEAKSYNLIDNVL